MKLPDGWVFEVEADKKCTEIRMRDRELVKCRNCKHYQQDGPILICGRLDSPFATMRSDDWCSYGEVTE